MNYRDYYEILGINKNSDKAEMKRAYRKLAMQYHPDQNPDDKEAEEKFKEINEAYQVLSDSEKRAHYDRLGTDYNRYQQGGGKPGGFNWGEYTRGPAAGGVNVDYEDLFGGDFSDFFSQIFGGMGGFGPGQRRRSAQQPQKFETEMIVSLHEIYNGSTRQITINDRRFDVKVPRGAHSGTKLRLRGAGPNKSDVYLKLKVSADPRFDLRGKKLYSEVVIDLYTAVLGGEVKIPTLAGNIMLTIPAGTQSGKTFKIKGRGLPSIKQKGKNSDLFVNIIVEIPKDLSPEERKIFEKLAKSKK